MSKNNLWNEDFDLISTTSANVLKHSIDKQGMLISKSNAEIPRNSHHKTFLFEKTNRQNVKWYFFE